MSRKLILGFALGAALFFFALVAFHPLLALGVLILSHMLILFPTLAANCQWWGPVVTHFETTKREAWLTIDDGPDPIHTPRMLEILARFEARATFFVIGLRAAKFPHELEAIRAAGHGIANHTATHPSATFWCLPPGRIAAEIDRCNIGTRFFRAPAGMKNFFVHPALRRRDLQLVGWTVRGLDTVSNDANAVAARILRKVKPGAILLLHEGHRTETEPEFHPDCLERTLAALTKANYRCVLPQPEQLRPRAGGK
ncbi:MAG TPA: polysaccharide deacetylase family protein [Chthoniobacterales bacterium]|jgi:peptidoglycan/xylan/chitin deacetylase (PgdA/CDA1 family)|nr:polysaccharide deacetylase family protein [Chthoniobacterales bacterium]